MTTHTYINTLVYLVINTPTIHKELPQDKKTCLAGEKTYAMCSHQQFVETDCKQQLNEIVTTVHFCTKTEHPININHTNTVTSRYMVTCIMNPSSSNDPHRQWMTSSLLPEQ